MAFSKGKKVFHGGTGEHLSTEKSPEAAKAKVRALHKEHNPKQANRGQRAAKRVGASQTARAAKRKK